MITIDPSSCVGCGTCAEACPTRAIIMIGRKVLVREGHCRACGRCVEACPEGAITMMPRTLYPYATKEVGEISSGFSRGFRYGGRHRTRRRWR
jgi:ferredoxin